MLRIRKVQECIESSYLQDQMKTPIHLCIGQEAVAVGFCRALEGRDYVTSNHRGHGHYLAKGGDLNRLIAELHGKKDGCSKGFGGSMHLVDVSVNHMGSSSIVGGGIATGTGLGLALKMRQIGAVSVIFFGDGAADEGILYESINFAVYHRLPVVYVLENNQWSVHSHVSHRQVDKNIFHYASHELLMSDVIDGNDVQSVYETAQQAVARAKSGQGPSFIECKTYRILGHAGCQSQDPDGYRSREEIESWKRKCPLDNYRQRLIDDGTIGANDFDEMEKRIGIEIKAAFGLARQSPFASDKDLCKFLYSE
jgi:pyruvate dehydrogenase E1 component alpha subunit